MVCGLVALAATFSGHAAGQPGLMRVDLQGYWNIGRMGYAHLVSSPAGTDVVVQVAPSNGVTLPLHLYTYVHQGSCANLGARTAVATRRVLGYREPSGLYTVRNTVPVSLDTLRASPHAVTVRSAPADGDQLLYCGDLRLS